MVISLIPDRDELQASPKVDVVSSDKSLKSLMNLSLLACLFGRLPAFCTIRICLFFAHKSCLASRVTPTIVKRAWSETRPNVATKIVFVALARTGLRWVLPDRRRFVLNVRRPADSGFEASARSTDMRVSPGPRRAKLRCIFVQHIRIWELDFRTANLPSRRRLTTDDGRPRLLETGDCNVGRFEHAACLGSQTAGRI